MVIVFMCHICDTLRTAGQVKVSFPEVVPPTGPTQFNSRKQFCGQWSLALADKMSHFLPSYCIRLAVVLMPVKSLSNERQGVQARGQNYFRRLRLNDLEPRT